jgi:hypothetical protein
MAGESITVRLDAQMREKIDDESKAQGMGPSSLVRTLVEAEIVRLRKERIRAGLLAVGEYLEAHPTAFDDDAPDDPSDWFDLSAAVVSGKSVH